MSPPKRAICAVLGDGGWGTTLAIHLYRLGHQVRWWGAFPDYLRILKRRHENPKYLPGIPIPRQVEIISDLSQAVTDSTLVILAVPSQYLRFVVRALKPFVAPLTHTTFVSAAKGIEQESLKRMSQVLTEELGAVELAALSGPSIAQEVAEGHPASIVVASRKTSVAKKVQEQCMGRNLRLYTSMDLVGVELGGALKNPIAIAAGVSDGLGFGANAKAALISRGIVEIARLGVALGAREETFRGLSGLGDLVTTSISGRNRWLGEQLGRGRRLKTVLSGTPMVIEGVETARAALALGRCHKVELPIIEQVHAILFSKKSPRKALQALMVRAGKSELS